MVALRCHAVLLDLDGVLVDSTASVERHWAAWAARRGVDLAAIRRAMHGRRSPDTIREVAPGLDADAEGLVVDRAQAGDPEGIVALPGAARLLTALAGAPWAVVTSGPGFLARARLGMAGLPEPAVLVTGDAVPRGKPDPAGYLAAAAALDVAPEACVVVEDAPAGVAAGRAAGMTVVGLTTHHPPWELPGAAPVARDLSDVDVAGVGFGGVFLQVRPV